MFYDNNYNMSNNICQDVKFKNYKDFFYPSSECDKLAMKNEIFKKFDNGFYLENDYKLNKCFSTSYFNYLSDAKKNKLDVGSCLDGLELLKSSKDPIFDVENCGGVRFNVFICSNKKRKGGRRPAPKTLVGASVDCDNLTSFVCNDVKYLVDDNGELLEIDKIKNEVENKNILAPVVDDGFSLSEVVSPSEVITSRLENLRSFKKSFLNLEKILLCNLTANTLFVTYTTNFNDNHKLRKFLNQTIKNLNLSIKKIVKTGKGKKIVTADGVYYMCLYVHQYYDKSLKINIEFKKNDTTNIKDFYKTIDKIETIEENRKSKLNSDFDLVAYQEQKRIKTLNNINMEYDISDFAFSPVIEIPKIDFSFVNVFEFHSNLNLHVHQYLNCSFNGLDVAFYIDYKVLDVLFNGFKNVDFNKSTRKNGFVHVKNQFLAMAKTYKKKYENSNLSNKEIDNLVINDLKKYCVSYVSNCIDGLKKNAGLPSSKQQTKQEIKSNRLKYYCKNSSLFSCSKNVKRPVITRNITGVEVFKMVGSCIPSNVYSCSIISDIKFTPVFDKNNKVIDVNIEKFHFISTTIKLTFDLSQEYFFNNYININSVVGVS